MDTDENVSSLMKSIDMDSIEKHLREVTPFTLLIKFVDAQQALEECGLIYDPKNGMYQSLEEGTRWKAEANPEGGVVVSPAPVTYENITSGEMGVSIGGTEIEEEDAKLDGLTADSAQGSAMDGPNS